MAMPKVINKIIKDLASLDARTKWSIFSYNELCHDVRVVHEGAETLVQVRDAEGDYEDIELTSDEYQTVKEYIEVADRLERIINYAMWKLRRGIYNDDLLPPDYD